MHAHVLIWNLGVALSWVELFWLCRPKRSSNWVRGSQDSSLDQPFLREHKHKMMFLFNKKGKREKLYLLFPKCFIKTPSKGPLSAKCNKTMKCFEHVWKNEESLKLPNWLNHKKWSQKLSFPLAYWITRKLSSSIQGVL